MEDFVEPCLGTHFIFWMGDGSMDMDNGYGCVIL